MKMVKSLLLGSAAGLVAVAGAQAADLPVKAKPVEYVKICSLYGVGFYYIPGTDMCLKIGGWVRTETAWGTNGSSTASVSASDTNNNSTNNWWWRARGYITADARSQTEYGTIRSYIAVGLSGDNAVAFSANRAFIQWAGFTFGLAQSFYDFYSAPATNYIGWIPSEDTGDGGQWVMGYTAQFGNGFSSTLAAEVPRQTQIINGNLNSPCIISGVTGTIGNFWGDCLNQTGFQRLAPAPLGGSTVGGAGGTGAYGGLQTPDIVGNLRVDQAWGSAQIMAAGHYVNSVYYNAGSTNAGQTIPQVEQAGHPDAKWGWVVGAGLKLNAPMIGVGDYFQGEVNYTEGALRYLAVAQGGGNYYIQHGDGVAEGILADAVYGGYVLHSNVIAPGSGVPGGTATGLNLTTGWSLNAAYEHFWNPRWRTSLYGSYMEVKYGDQANNILCSAQYPVGRGGGVVPPQGSAIGATPGCDNDWNFWTIGSRTQWNVTKEFYLGLDVAYGRLSSGTTLFQGENSAPATTAPALTATSGGAGVLRSVGHEDIWTARFRVHRDFYP